MSCNKTTAHGEPNIERLLWLTARFVAERMEKENERTAKDDGKHDHSVSDAGNGVVRRG